MKADESSTPLQQLQQLQQSRGGTWAEPSEVASAPGGNSGPVLYFW